MDPRRVVEAALETMQPAAQAKGITVVPLLDTGAATVRGDFARLAEALSGTVWLGDGAEPAAPWWSTNVETEL